MHRVGPTAQGRRAYDPRASTTMGEPRGRIPQASAGRPGAGSPRRGRDRPLEAPTLAFLVATLGGWLVVVEGMLLVGSAGTTFDFGLPIPADAAAQLGGVGVALGLGIVGVGFVLHETQGSRRGVGLVIVVLGAGALAAGGGFLLGSVLTVVGGLIALFARPTPLFHPGHYARK